jgi:hypothetical protein
LSSHATAAITTIMAERIRTSVMPQAHDSIPRDFNAFRRS